MFTLHYETFAPGYVSSIGWSPTGDKAGLVIAQTGAVFVMDIGLKSINGVFTDTEGVGAISISSLPNPARSLQIITGNPREIRLRLVAPGVLPEVVSRAKAEMEHCPFASAPESDAGLIVFEGAVWARCSHFPGDRVVNKISARQFSVPQLDYLRSARVDPARDDLLFTSSHLQLVDERPALIVASMVPLEQPYDVATVAREYYVQCHFLDTSEPCWQAVRISIDDAQATNQLRSVRASPDGKLLAFDTVTQSRVSKGLSRRLVLLDATEGRAVHRLADLPADSYGPIDFDFAGGLGLVAAFRYSRGARLVLFNALDGALAQEVGVAGAYRISVSPGGHHVFVAEDARLRVFRLQ